MGGFANYPSLEDRTVFITGGASGIGESLVEAFVRQKSRVAFIDLDFDASQALQKRLEDEGLQKPWFKPCDVRDIASLEKCLRNAALDLGPVSVLVNNAGNDERHKADEISVEYWDERIAVNLRHQFFAAREVARDMKENGGGSIINISSIDGMRAGFRPNVPYGVAKGGIISMTRHTAVHHGRENIRVNCIAPGHIHTTFVSSLSEEDRELRRRISPLGTEGTAWDVAWAAVYLASDEARWVSGVVLPVDAGLFAGSPLSVVDNLMDG